MSPATKNPPVAAPAPASYTRSVSSERTAAFAPWWQDVVRFWVPVLGIGVLVMFQMLGIQRQIGDLRADLQGEIGTLRADLQGEIGTLRADLQGEIGTLRADLQGEIGTLRQEMASLRADLQGEIETLRRDMETLRADLGERIARIETLLETRGGAAPAGSRGRDGSAATPETSAPGARRAGP